MNYLHLLLHRHSCYRQLKLEGYHHRYLGYHRNRRHRRRHILHRHNHHRHILHRHYIRHHLT